MASETRGEAAVDQTLHTDHHNGSLSNGPSDMTELTEI